MTSKVSPGFPGIHLHFPGISCHFPEDFMPFPGAFTPFTWVLPHFAGFVVLAVIVHSTGVQYVP